MATKIAEFTTASQDEYLLTFPFDRELVEELKARLPVAGRRFDPDRKGWRIAERYVDYAIDIVLDRGYDCLLDGMPYPPRGWSHQGGGRAGGPVPDPDDADLSLLHLRPSAPAEVVEAAFRALAKLKHPDARPPAERPTANREMEALNAAVARLRARPRAS